MATRYRDLQSPVSLQTGLVDNSPARAAQSLAQSFSEFENVAGSLGGALREQQGLLEGEAAGAGGMPQPRSGLAATTRYGAAYNGAAEVSYANKVSMDVAADLDRIETEAEADPLLYGEKTKGLMEGTLADAPPEWRTRLEQHIAPRVQAGAMRVARAADTVRKQEALAGHLDSEPVVISQLVRTVRELPGEAGDAELARVVAERHAQIDALVADHVIDPVQAQRLRQSFGEEVDKALSADRTGSLVEEIVAAARTDVEAADDLLTTIDARDDLSLEEKTAVRSAYREQSELLRFERTRVHMEDLAGLSRRLAAGEFSGIRAEAGRLYRRGALSPAEYEQYVGAAERNRQAEIEKDSDKEAAGAVDFMDPGDPAHQKAAEQFFQDLTKVGGMKPGDDRWRATAIALVQQKNILPKSAESWARTALMSGDPLLAVQAADFMDRVRSANKVAAAWNQEPKLVALASLLQDNVASNLDPVAAYELARRSTVDLKDSVAAVLAEDYKTAVKKDPNATAVGNLMNDIYTGQSGWQNEISTIPPQARAEYESLVRQYFTLTNGSLEKAREIAGQQLTTTWGVETVHGKPEFVKFPASRLVPAEVIRADIDAALAPLGVAPGAGRLVHTDATDRTKGTNWGIGFPDEYGFNEILLGPDNRPVPYGLPLGKGFKESRAAARQKNEARALAEIAAENKAEADRRAVMRPDSLTPGLR